MFRDSAGALRVVYREVVVPFDRHASQSRRKAVLAKYGLKVRERNAFHDDQVIAYNESRRYVAERMVELANDLTETEEVVFAFPNFVSEFRRAAVPTPIKAQWHLKTVEARRAWAKTQGQGIAVAILDDGIDIGHPDLTRNILRNPDPNEPRDLNGRDFFVGDDAPDHFDPRPKRFRPRSIKCRVTTLTVPRARASPPPRATLTAYVGLRRRQGYFRSRFFTPTTLPYRVSPTRYDTRHALRTFCPVHGQARHRPT